ncbi:hypothetical protein [Xanthomonas campestris]|uniref:hypothetical protein n=1 Tax=Xanthomonas campestris TaxID=339 RepID=UPI002B22F5BF|nr:hypothetical protein [Xanthomonas campestris]MEA9706782.1 hypothetical protein [Xanthomonas campestris pv. raphani]MEA9729270.1 hypothetical protein [Xanthomonas campestris pv. raphani]MEA9900743.1 hypothetical protein [Xanthomonas campestris pv. raphani]
MIRRTALVRSRRPLEPSSQVLKFDLWLQRISLITQPILLITTLITIKLTVIPLYEKAQLDEILARREIELKNATEALNRVYPQARFYIAKQFSLNVYYNCLQSKSEMEWVKSSPGTYPIDLKKMWLEKLNFDIETCVNNLAKSEDTLKELYPSDQAILRDAIETFGRSTKVLQARNLEKWNAAPKLARADPKKYINDGLTRQSFDALLVQLGAPTPVRDEVADATTDLQTSIAIGYSRELYELGRTQLQPWEAPSPADQP